jgi:hypothetical protein
VQLFTEPIQTVAFNYSSVVKKIKEQEMKNTGSTVSGAQRDDVYFFKHAERREF